VQKLTAYSTEKKISHRHWGPLRGSSSPFGPLSRRGLNPIKPVYDPDRPDGRFNLTASAFNQLGQYTSSPGHRGYCYVSSLAVVVTIASTHCAYPRKDGQVELAWEAGYVMRKFTIHKSPIPVLTGLNVEQLRWSRPTRYLYTKPPQFTLLQPRAGSGVVRMVPIRFLAGCRTRRLNQV